MRSKLLTRIRGSVLLEIRGEQIEQLVNELLHHNLEVWNITRTSEDHLQLELHLNHFFRLRPLLKQTGCRLRIIRKSGLPFRLERAGRRKGAVLGVFLFFILLYGMSMIVWDVQVEGVEKISQETVLQAAEESGIYPRQWKFKMKTPSDLSSELVRKLDGVSWVGVTIEGTKVNIQVVESAQAEQKPLMNPRHLVAAHDAVVSNIFAEKGQPVVQPNTHVKKGDVLISGIVGDEENNQVVVAEGEVKGWVWYEYQVTVPLAQKRKVYTGNTSHLRYIVIGDRGLKISGYKAPKFDKFESDQDRHVWQWRNFTLPIGWMSETVREVSYDVRQLEAEEAVNIGLNHARSEVLLEAGNKAEITDETLLSKTIGEKEVTLTLLFEVDQHIATEQAIVHDPEAAEDIEQTE